jgi:hypothetical protein
MEMDLSAISLAAATLLASKAGEGLAAEAGKSVWGGMQRLYDLVRERFHRNAESEQALKRLEAAPYDQVRIRAVAAAMQAQAQVDADFRQQLVALVGEAQNHRATQVTVAQAFDQAKQANVAGDNFGTITLT